MQTIQAMKAAHIKQSERRWDDAVHSILRLLGYDRSLTYQGEFNDAERQWDAKIRKLTQLLMTADSSDLHAAFGWYMPSENTYGPILTTSALDLMEFVSFFVGHEIIDDGEPGIAYARRTYRTHTLSSGKVFNIPTGERVRCKATDEGAKPYFVRSIDVLREFDSDAKWASVDAAIEVLEGYAARSASGPDPERIALVEDIISMGKVDIASFQ